jgi:hypothetical protein
MIRFSPLRGIKMQEMSKQGSLVLRVISFLHRKGHNYRMRNNFSTKLKHLFFPSSVFSPIDKGSAKGLQVFWIGMATEEPTRI